MPQRNIAIPRNVTLPEPLIISDVFSRLTIIAEEGSRAVIHEPKTDGHDRSIEVIVRSGARIEYDALQTGAAKVTRTATVEGDAELYWSITVLDDIKTDIAVTTTLVAAGAHVVTTANMIGMDDQTTLLDATHVHAAPNTESETFIRGVFGGRSRGVWNGMTHIQPRAAGSRGHQTFKALLLSKDASVEPSPQLKIENDNVACGHAASIGHLDPDQLFYLMSRGYAEPDARRCIIEGFMEPDRSPWSTEIRAALARCL